jgi:hypothetical protein
MRKIFLHTTFLLFMGGSLFACRGGANKNNDHDYDGKNENTDRGNTNQYSADSSDVDTLGQIPDEEKK